MYKQLRIAVIVPVYNVAPHIESVVDSIPSFVDRIIVVNDCSRDGTAEILRRIQNPRMLVLTHEKNQGVGGAVVTGFRCALEDQYDVCVKMDGDGQMDPHYLPDLLDPLAEDGYGYAKGNRFLDSERLQTMPAVRLFGNYVLTFLTKMSSGYWHVFDPQNGYLAIRREALTKIDLPHLAKRYFFENDMMVHLNVFNVRVKDVSMPARYGDEKSSMRLSEIVLTFPRYLVRRFCYRLYQKHILRDFSPIALFWVLGTGMFGWGFLFGLFTWGKSIVLHQVATTGTVMLSVLPLMLGFELILQGMILEIRESPR